MNCIRQLAGPSSCMCCNALATKVSSLHSADLCATCVIALLNWLACIQEAVDNLMGQVSQLAAPGSRLCFDALHRNYMDGRVKMRGYTNGARVREREREIRYILG